MIEQLLLSGRAAFSKLYESTGCLPPLLVGHSHHRHKIDGGVSVQGILYFDGRNILAPGNNNVLGTIANFNITVGVLHR